MSTLGDWTAAVRADLGFDPEPLSTAETRAVLDIRRGPYDRLTGPAVAGRDGVAVRQSE